jgi:hypothetical protein
LRTETRFRIRPWSATHGCLLGIEPAKSGDEALGIPAPVGMMGPNELPAAPLDVPRPALVADVCHVAPVDDDGNFL